ncbi:MAG: ABC transporter ATP-binding protein [Candidatus Hodarchaeales archaeon]
MTNVIEVKNLSKTYDMGEFEVKALHDISFTIQPHEFVGLIGPSGCGKTTLINTISGLLKPTTGEVRLNGTVLTELSSDKVRDFRLHNIGLVFQDHLLVNSLTALENVELPLVFARVPEEERKQKATYLLKKFGLQDKMYNLPEELSGGEQQRVGIARSLIFNPAIILADEPTGDLDTKSGQLILKTFRDIVTSEGTSILMVSHDPRHRPFFDRVLELSDGKLVTIE